MSRKVFIQHYVDGGGIEYGRVVKPSEMMDIQNFAHEHTEMVTRDLLMKNAPAPQVSGFGYTLAGGMNLTIASGHAVDALGRSFETLPTGQAAGIVIPAAHASQPRIDLVYAALSADQNAENAPLPHRRLLTSLELAQGADPYPIENFNVATQRQNRATVAVRQGVASANPAAPVAGANETPLYHVRVEASANTITADKVTDVRTLMRSLRDAWVNLDGLNNSPAFLNLSEAIDDRVNALTVDSPYLTKVYNDPGNLLTFDVDIAAVGSALDTRFVNVTGDTMNGQLKNVNGGTDPLGSANSALHAVRAGGGPAAPSPTAIYGYGEAGVGNGDVAYGAYFTSHANRALAVLNTTSFGVFARTEGGHTRHAGFFEGNVTCTGVLSKGSGTFHIDHPLDPENKDLIHGFVESNRYGLLYCFDVQVTDGDSRVGFVDVDVDAALGFTVGTLKALTQNIKIASLRHPTNLVVTPTILQVENPANPTTIRLQTQAGDTSLVTVLIYAERADPFIKSTEFVDAQGRLVPERDKAALTAAEAALLDPVTVTVPAGDPRIGQTISEVLPQLIGKVGFPRQPAVLVGGAQPTRPVTYEAEE